MGQAIPLRVSSTPSPPALCKMGACGSHCSSERKQGLEQPHTAMPANTLLSNRTPDIKKSAAEVALAPPPAATCEETTATQEEMEVEDVEEEAEAQFVIGSR